MKHCNTCNQTKQTSEFSKRKASPDGLSAKCKQCDSAAKRQWREKNKDKYQEYNKEYHQRNKEKVNSRSAAWRQENPERAKRNVREWHRRNPEIANAHSRLYRHEKRHPRRFWQCDEHRKEVERIYEEKLKLNREAGGVAYHVDHIVPLKGQTVCGLHVPWNLQIVPAKENMSKGNRTWPNMW